MHKERKMDRDKKIIFSESVFAQEVDGEMVLLDMNSENYFGLDETGTSIWQAMQEHQADLQKVLSALLEKYDVEEDVLKRDLAVFIEKLKENGLIEVKEA